MKNHQQHTAHISPSCCPAQIHIPPTYEKYIPPIVKILYISPDLLSFLSNCENGDYVT